MKRYSAGEPLPLPALSYGPTAAPSSLIGSLFINNVESNLGDPGDWIELYNAGAEPIDVSGFLRKDDSDGRTSRIAAGTIMAPGGFLRATSPSAPLWRVSVQPASTPSMTMISMSTSARGH